MGHESVTRRVDFEAAHLLHDYNGPCASLHGHSYSLEVTVSGIPDPDSAPEDFRNTKDFGFCIDFKHLNAILKEVIPDHKFIANAENCQEGTSTPEGEILLVLKKYNLAYVLMPAAPSAENMKNWIRQQIDERLPAGLRVSRIRLWETRNSYAEWEE